MYDLELLSNITRGWRLCSRHEDAKRGAAAPASVRRTETGPVDQAREGVLSGIEQRQSSALRKGATR
ncbi:hypothetical protein AAW51_3502 [Caldimonas brevitalea]|uniref:Uncharacterized protein n=1 Tax=Caldimonas brevitalea TaxID=413882 RepID=A0A0G3BQD3_9BURK|nr:hypothetical protein AAW51_3502 [Caldimonas brevitalea]